MRTVIVTDKLYREGAWRLVERGEAVFHSFGLDFEEFSDGGCGYSVAIVEWPDGRVEMVRADRVQFVEPTTEANPGEDVEKNYRELIFAVASKFPGETRHQTALRYIRNAESGKVHTTTPQAAEKP